jgi:hypothetical protein
MNLGMDNERDIVYSQAIKAGKRIYYLDVKRNKRDELFLSITESKKKLQGEGLDAPFTFEKHKIFLYQEDFGKFIEGLSKAIGYIHANQPLDERFAVTDKMPMEEPVDTQMGEPLENLDGALDIQIDFE